VRQLFDLPHVPVGFRKTTHNATGPLGILQKCRQNASDHIAIFDDQGLMTPQNEKAQRFFE
jgi:hypothetical protein